VVWSFLLLAVRDFTFHDASKRLPMAIGIRKLWHGFSQILLPEGKGRFCLIRTEYRGYSTAAIYLCIDEKVMATDGMKLNTQSFIQ
jgi:hypothetical protein